MRSSFSTRLDASRRGPLVARSRRRLCLPGGPADGVDDVLVPGAAADVAGDRPADLLLARVSVLLEQRLRDQHHPRRAEAALEPVLLLEPLLDRVQSVRAGEPLDRRQLAPVR